MNVLLDGINDDMDDIYTFESIVDNKKRRTRLTSKNENIQGVDGRTIRIYNKLSKLEDIEEESGLCETGSSLVAFLQTPYIQSILRLYVDARKLRGLKDE